MIRQAVRDAALDVRARQSVGVSSDAIYETVAARLRERQASGVLIGRRGTLST